MITLADTKFCRIFELQPVETLLHCICEDLYYTINVLFFLLLIMVQFLILVLWLI